MVTQSGNGTFTGPGTANPTKFFIPRKNEMPPAIAAMARQIETFVNSLNAIGSFVPYASLTGPGETTTPGELVQHGPFFATDNSATGIELTENGSGPIELNSNSSGQIEIGFGTGGFTVQPTGSSGNILIKGPTSAGTVTVEGVAVDIINSGPSGTLLLGQGQTVTIDAGNFVTFTINGVTFNLGARSGSPNGVVTSVHKGDLILDNSTPGLWIANAAASTSWTAL